MGVFEKLREIETSSDDDSDLSHMQDNEGKNDDEDKIGLSYFLCIIGYIC